MIAGSRDDISRNHYDRWRGRESPRSNAANIATHHFHETPNFETDSFEEDLRLQLARLQAIGIEQVVVVDLTQPEFGIPVVRVVIPGMHNPRGEE